MNGTELHERLTSYLRLREALGISLGSESKVLENFVDFAGTHESAEPITSLMVFDWLDATPKQRLGNARRRLGVVRQFLLHLSASLPDTQVPETRLLCGHRRPTPFVFSPEQKELLLQGAMAFAPGTFFSTVLHTVLGLISVTGLRASEAVELDRSDVLVQADSATLLIRESKFQKSRIVPLHTSTAQHLTAYLDQRAGLGKGPETTALFISRRGNRLSYEILQTCFRKLVERVGIRARAGVNKPTLHSLRHSFVVTRLQAWHEEGVDVQSRLAHLATYLGHVGIRESYWYVTATPELLSAAVADFRPPALTGGDQ
jgi:integrase